MDWTQAGIIFAFVFCGLLLAKPIASVFGIAARTRKSSLAVTMVFCAIAAVEADKPDSPAKKVLRRIFGMTETVTQEDVSRGYKLESETRDAEFSYTMPPDAVSVGNWFVHGATSDFGNNRTSLCGMNFPIGPDDRNYASAWYSLDASLKFGWGEDAREIAAVGAPLLASPGASRLWRTNDEDSVTFAWENMFTHDSTSSCVNAAITLYANGDFTTRSNDVMRTYRRINPDDWDGDGLANDADNSPRVSNGDCFGTGAGWLAANPSITAATNAVPGAYYQLNFTATERWTRIDVACDGASDLGDMTIIANEGQDCSIPLLRGARYEILATAPLEQISATLDDAVITQLDPPPGGFRAASIARKLRTAGIPLSKKFSVYCPVDFSIVDRGDGAWQIATGVVDLPVETISVAGGCCNLSTNSTGFIWSCHDDCACAGYMLEVEAIVRWCGYTAAISDWISCGCSQGDAQDCPPEPSTTIAFSAPVAVYEEPYRDVAGHPLHGGGANAVRLSGVVNGGSCGGVWSVILGDGGKLEKSGGAPLPENVAVAPGEKRRFFAEYHAVRHSGCANDIEAISMFIPNDGSPVISEYVNITAVKVELMPESEIEGAEYRHIWGINEDIKFIHTPSLEDLSICCKNGTIIEKHPDTLFRCPMAPSINDLYIIYAGRVIYDFTTLTIQPTGVAVVEAHEYEFDIPDNFAGGAGMRLSLVILPQTVSFLGLFFQELPTTEYAPSGYFSDSHFDEIWYHTTNLGAGVWRRAKKNNNWFDDSAICAATFPGRNELEWTSGTIHWKIPIAWTTDETAAPTNFMGCQHFPECDQIFTMNASGAFRISKYNYWVERAPDGTRRKSEGDGRTWTEN